MTEAEAKKKWCPMVRFERDLVNRSDPHVLSAKCIGSACMLWRWDIVPEEIDGDKNWDGHCGLAGKP